MIYLVCRVRNDQWLIDWGRAMEVLRISMEAPMAMPFQDMQVTLIGLCRDIGLV